MQNSACSSQICTYSVHYDLSAYLWIKPRLIIVCLTDSTSSARPRSHCDSCTHTQMTVWLLHTKMSQCWKIKCVFWNIWYDSCWRDWLYELNNKVLRYACDLLNNEASDILVAAVVQHVKVNSDKAWTTTQNKFEDVCGNYQVPLVNVLLYKPQLWIPNTFESCSGLPVRP